MALVLVLLEDRRLDLRLLFGAELLAGALACSRLTWASTPAACSPPITPILAFGHIHRKRGS